MRNLRDSKSGLPLLELLKIPVTWSNFIIAIIFFFFFTISLFVLISRNTSIFVPCACYRPQDSGAVVE